MKLASITRIEDGRAIAEKATIADTCLQRTVGLIGSPPLIPGEAMLITKCSMIHMCLMNYPIDAIFCDSSNKIVGLVKKLKPWRFSRWFPNASYVIEITAGEIDSLELAIGQSLRIVPY